MPDLNRDTPLLQVNSNETVPNDTLTIAVDSRQWGTGLTASGEMTSMAANPLLDA